MFTRRGDTFVLMRFRAPIMGFFLLEVAACSGPAPAPQPQAKAETNAVIGGATGAGAGVGIEAARKGEQIRVDSESRLDFRLEQPLQVTIESPSPGTTQPRNNPSDLPRFGTRPK
jgi:hypothetical protein